MTVDQTLIALRRASENDYPWSVSPHEAAALIAEVERLRELLLNAGWPKEADGIAELALQAERAAVVAWLREQRQYETDELIGQGFATVCGILSDCIERGEHRREEEE